MGSMDMGTGMGMGMGTKKAIGIHTHDTHIRQPAGYTIVPVSNTRWSR
jgi:hypothetical protein